MGDFCENTAGGTGEQASWEQAELLARFLSKGGGGLACQRWCWWQIGHVRGGVVKQGCWALVLGLCRSAKTQLASSAGASKGCTVRGRIRARWIRASHREALGAVRESSWY